MTSSPDHDEDGQPPFRYDATLANEIELAWQARWAADGTFQAPNPVGSLSAGFEQAAGGIRRPTSSTSSPTRAGPACTSGTRSGTSAPTCCAGSCA